jgi:hypothetical protein
MIHVDAKRSAASLEICNSDFDEMFVLVKKLMLIASRVVVNVAMMIVLEQGIKER